VKLNEAAWGLDIQDEWQKTAIQNKGESAKCCGSEVPAFDLAGVHASDPDHPAITSIHGFNQAMMIHRQTFVEKKILGSPRGFGESRTLAHLNPSEFHHLASSSISIHACVRISLLNTEMGACLLGISSHARHTCMQTSLLTINLKSLHHFSSFSKRERTP
jgi:hypothetical protein